MTKELSQKRGRLYEIVEIGASTDLISRGYDFISTAILVLNLIISLLYTFDYFETRFSRIMLTIEALTMAFFAVDYVLRLLTAKCKRPDLPEGKALIRYIFSLAGFIDLVSFLPYYLPFFFPSGAVAFRLFRVIRIFRLFRLNAYYDSLNVITEVISGKRQQLLSSVFIILVLMTFSSLCMYSLEHEAQPEVFKNAFSGIWWSVSTVLTVGYGDIYPITVLGRIFSIIITFLGVGLVAIPTGIISAGFVEQYTKLQQYGDYMSEKDLHFLKFRLKASDPWIGKMIKDLQMSKAMIICMVIRQGKLLIPKGNLTLEAGDLLLLTAEDEDKSTTVRLNEVILGKHHPWINTAVCDLDISRQTVIVMIKRHETMLVPHGDTILKENDTLFLCTKAHISSDNILKI